MATPARATWKLLAWLMLLAHCSASLPGTTADASVAKDAGEDVWCAVHFDQAVSCIDGGAPTPGPCSDPPGTTTHSDAGFAVGCTNIEDDHRYFDPDAGACVTPFYTCVATPTPHWELSFVNVGIP